MDFKKFSGTMIHDIPEIFGDFEKAEKRRAVARPEDSEGAEKKAERRKGLDRPFNILRRLVLERSTDINMERIKQLTPVAEEVGSRNLLIDGFKELYPLLPYISEKGHALRCSLEVEGNIAILVDKLPDPTEITRIVPSLLYLLLSTTGESGVTQHTPISSFNLKEVHNERDILLNGFTWAKTEKGDTSIWDGGPISYGSREHAALEAVLGEALMYSQATDGN